MPTRRSSRRSNRAAAPDVRIDRTALIHGVLIAAVRERERRRAAERAKGEEAWDRLLDTLAAMGQRAAGHPPSVALAEQLAQAVDWAAIEAMRGPHDLSAAECIALVLTVDQEAALRLLGEYCATEANSVAR